MVAWICWSPGVAAIHHLASALRSTGDRLTPGGTISHAQSSASARSQIRRL